MRREEFNALLKDGGAIELKSNNAYDIIEFTIPLEEKWVKNYFCFVDIIINVLILIVFHRDNRVEASLTYGDLKSSIPTNVIIHLIKKGKSINVKYNFFSRSV